MNRTDLMTAFGRVACGRRVARALVTTSVAILAVMTPDVASAIDAETDCVARKLSASAKHCQCVMRAEQRGLATGTTADTTRCDDALSRRFAKAELRGAGACRTVGDVGTISARLTSLGGELSDSLGGPAAGSRDAVKCVGRKLRAAAKACSCEHNARRRALLGDARLGPDTSRCTSRLDGGLAKAEASAAGACPAGADAAAVLASVVTQTEEVEADLLDLDTDAFAERGPFGVGHRSFTLVDTSRPTPANGEYPGAAERTLDLLVHFPADRPNSVGSAANALVFPDGPPLPLIVRAHGFSGFNADSTELTIHLASHGFIVVSVNFPLSYLQAPGDPTILDLGGQAGDLSFLITSFLAKHEDENDMFYGRVDASRIGVNGLSLGGATVLLAGYHSTLADPRIGAVAALAPLSCSFTETLYDGGDAPLLVVGGTGDLVTQHDANHVLPYTLADPEKYLLAITEGTHTGFINPLLADPFENPDDVLACAVLIPDGVSRPIPSTAFSLFPEDFLGGLPAGIDPDGTMCAPLCPLPTAPVIDQREQLRITKASVVAFFDSVLSGDVSADRLMTGGMEAEIPEVTQLFEK